MPDYLRQQLIEMTQRSDAYHAELVAELRAEIKRLRTNINAMQTYAEVKAEKYEEAAEDGRYMAQYFRGKADVYSEMAARANIAYGGSAE